jgi:hypothetical protein
VDLKVRAGSIPARGTENQMVMTKRCNHFLFNGKHGDGQGDVIFSSSAFDLTSVLHSRLSLKNL